MKSVLRCQIKPKSAVCAIIELLIDMKKSVAACGPLKRPRQAFSCLSITQCFDFCQSRKAVDVGQRGDVIRWSVFDLLPRFALNSVSILFFQLRSQPSFESLLRLLKRQFSRGLATRGFVTAICDTMRSCIQSTVFSFTTGNPLFSILKLVFALTLFYVVYRVIKRAILKV